MCDRTCHIVSVNIPRPLPECPYLQALQRAIDGMRRSKFVEPLLRHVSAGTDAFFRRPPSLKKI
jgi:hypothetical protein